MPIKPPHQCIYPGCGELTRGRYCARHQRSVATTASAEYEATRESAAKRGYDAKWRRLREIVLERDPLCRECKRQGRIEMATDVDHIKALASGGTNAMSNLQSLCHACHSRKTVAQDGAFRHTVQNNRHP